MKTALEGRLEFLTQPFQFGAGAVACESERTLPGLDKLFQDKAYLSMLWLSLLPIHNTMTAMWYTHKPHAVSVPIQSQVGYYGVMA